MILGTSTAGMPRTEKAYAHHCQNGHVPKHYRVWQQHAFHAMGTVVSHLTGATGPSYIVSTACSSSAKVFGCAERLLASGVVDAALVGGVDVLCRMTLLGFHSLGILSPTRCIPFAPNRTGINIGEGAAFLLLERHGEGRAYYGGIGESSDAHHMTAPHPQGAGAARAMAMAMQRANLEPEAIGCINAHATGTKLNDAAESTAIAQTISNTTPVTATKGLTGHTLGAAGATEAVLSILAMEDELLPACNNGPTPDPDMEANVVSAPQKKRYNTMLSNAFAFGGSNTTVVFTR